MSDPRKTFFCKGGHPTNDKHRYWGKQTPCWQCGVEKAKPHRTAQDRLKSKMCPDIRIIRENAAQLKQGSINRKETC